MTESSLVVTVAVEIDSVPVAIVAESIGTRRLITVAPTGTTNLSTVLKALDKFLSIDLSPLASSLWSELTDAPLSVTAWVASDAKGISGSLDLSFVQPIGFPGGELAAIVGTLAEIDGLTISYDPATGLQLKARIRRPTTTLFGSKDGAGSKPQIVGLPTAGLSPAPPVFHLNYLGIGQRVGPDVVLPGEKSQGDTIDDPLAAIFDELGQTLSTDDPAEIVKRVARDLYKPDRDWFLALDVTLRGFGLRALFNDPALYGLEITVAKDPPTVFSDLLFEILYQKLGPGLGVYYGALRLPDAMRRIEIDGAILVLPGFSIWVYTDGDFRVNVGWPLGPDSIGIIVGPLSGRAGFYFAKLRSGDDPGAVTTPSFDPILQFGMAMEVYAAVDCSAGPMSASLSLTYDATLQGVIAWLAPTDGAPGSVTRAPDHYWFAGHASMVLLIQGSIDFSIIKASLTIRLAAQIAVAYETTYATVVAVEAEVSVDLSVHVVFFTIHLSFHMRVSHSFTFGSGKPALLDGPRQDGLGMPTGGGPDAAPQPGSGQTSAPPPLVVRTTGDGSTTQTSSTALPPATAAPDPRRIALFTALFAPPATGQPTAVPVPASFALLPTATFPAAGSGRFAVVAALILASPPPAGAAAASVPAPTSLTAFEALATGMFRWLLGAVAAGASFSSAGAHLAAAGQALGHGSVPPSGVFGAREGFFDALDAGLAANLSLELAGVSEGPAGEPPPGAILPLPEPLILSWPGGRDIPLADLTVDAPYADALNGRYASLGLGPVSTPNGTALAQRHSLARLIFGDYMLILLRQLASSVVLTKPDATDMTAAGLAEAFAAVDFAGLAGFASRFLVSGLRLPEPSPAAAGSAGRADAPLRPLYEVTRQQFEVDDGASVVSAGLRRSSDAAAWISAPTVQASIALPAPPAEPAYRWSHAAPRRVMDDPSKETAPAPGSVVVRRACALAKAQLSVALNRTTAVSRDQAATRALLTLPPRLLDRVKADGGVTLRFPSDATALGDLEPALLVPIVIGRVPLPAPSAAAGTTPASPWRPGLYALTGGADDATRERLYDLLTDCGLRDPAHRVIDPAALTITLLTSVKGGLRDVAPRVPLADAPTLGLVRTRPSVVGGGRPPAATPDLPDDCDSADAATSPADFLRLLWEASTGDPAGMLLSDATTLGGGEAAVFAGAASGAVDILISLAPAARGAIRLWSWADRILAAAVPAGAVTALVYDKEDKGALYTKLPSSQPGALAFEVEIVRPPSPGAAGGPDIAGLYHLVQAAVGTSVDDDLPWGLPVGPDGGVTMPDGVWLCHQTLSPDGSGGRYAGIGQAVPLCFRLVDIFGNAMPQGYAAPGDAFAPLYADLLVTPAQWPGVQLSCAFTRRDPQNATLSLDAAFESSGIGPDGSGTRKAALERYDLILAQLQDANTRAVLRTDLDGGLTRDTDPASLIEVLGVLAGQIRTWLLQPSTIAFPAGSDSPPDGCLKGIDLEPWSDHQAARNVRLVVTGTGDDEHGSALGLGRASAVAALLVKAGFAPERVTAAAGAAAPWSRATIGLSMGTTATRPVSFAEVLKPGGTGADPRGDVMALHVRIDMFRTAFVDPDGVSDLPEIGLATCAVRPRTDPPPAAAGGTPAAGGIGHFARDFEAAFAGLEGPDGTTRLRLAQRSGIVEDDASLAQDLWAIRVGPQGIHMRPLAATTYALRPLANRALSGQLADHTIHNDVDLDASAAACLRAIDAALTPARAVALARLGAAPSSGKATAETTLPLHTRLLSAKRDLAAAIPMGLAKVLPESPDGDIAAARDMLEAALLASLGSAATVTAAVQMAVDLSVFGPVGDALDRATPPIFSGDVGATLSGPIPASADAAAPAVTPDQPSGSPGGHFFFSSAALPLPRPDATVPARPAVLTTLLSLAEASQRPAMTVDLTWSPAFVQHAFEVQETYSGYTPSAMLRFALPEAQPVLSYPSVTIPLPLWLDPARPKLGAHSAKGAEAQGDGADVTVSTGDELDAALVPLLGWSYDVSLSTQLSPQDELWFRPGFDLAPAEAANAGVPTALQGIFEAAVGMEAALPAFAAAFTELDGSDVEPERVSALAEQLAPFVTLARALADAWPRDPAPLDAASPEQASPAGWLRLTLDDDDRPASAPGHRLVLARRADPADAKAAPPDAGAWPRITLGGIAFTPEPVETPIEGGNFVGVAQTFDAKPDLGTLRLTWPAVALRDSIMADFSCFLRRNADFGGRPGADGFVLHTPELAFPTAAVPLLAPKGRLVIRPTRPLGDILAGLLGCFARIGTEANEAALSLACHYSYQLLPHLYPGAGLAGLPARLPVLIATDLPLPPEGEAARAGAMAGEIALWRARTRPTGRGASLDLALTLYGAPRVTGGERLALARLDRIIIPLEGASADFWPAPSTKTPS